jgi:hypothetical protein
MKLTTGVAFAFLSALIAHADITIGRFDLKEIRDVSTLETKVIEDWHPNPNIRRGPADYPIDDSQSSMRPLLFNGVGGSTVMWSCHAPRFHPSDFRMRSLDGVGRDWPIDYATLAPYYAINERTMGVSGAHGDPAMPPREARTTRPAPDQASPLISTKPGLPTKGFSGQGWVMTLFTSFTKVNWRASPSGIKSV